MLATVVALYNAAGLPLVPPAVMVLAMFAASAPGFAQGEGGCDQNPGMTEGSRSPITTPPQAEPGTGLRNSTANEHDPHEQGTGFGDRVEECA